MAEAGAKYGGFVGKAQKPAGLAREALSSATKNMEDDAGSGGQDDIADMVDGDSSRGATENSFGEGTSSAEAAGGTDPAQLRSKGEQTASSFWRCCQDRGLTAFCDALTFSGLRDELPRLAEPGITVLAPTNEAFAQLSDSARADQRLVRQLLLGHICPGRSTFADIQAKHCAVAVAGQTHACYAEEGYTFVGTSRLLRTDLSFDGGVVHELATCLTVLSLMRDAHSEQVWKKALQPAPLISAIGGVSALGVEFEIHGCLLHAATGQLVPEALRGHVRQIKPVNDEQRLTFGDIVIMTKPPSLAKRRGAAGAPDGSNRYRLLFSIWNTTSLSYISWQHMATPVVVRNSFHMLPLEEKNYRRAQYTIARGGGNSSKKIKDDFDSLPIVPEGESQQWGSPKGCHTVTPHDAANGAERGGGSGVGGSGVGGSDDGDSGGGVWLPLSAAALPGERGSEAGPGGTYRGKVRAESISTTEDDALSTNDQTNSSYAAPSIDNGMRDSIGTEPLWLAMSQAQEMGRDSPTGTGTGTNTTQEYMQMQVMASKQAANHSIAAAAQQRQAAASGVPMFPGATPAASAAAVAAATKSAVAKTAGKGSAAPTFGAAALSSAAAASAAAVSGAPSPDGVDGTSSDQAASGSAWPGSIPGVVGGRVAGAGGRVGAGAADQMRMASAAAMTTNKPNTGLLPAMPAAAVAAAKGPQLQDSSVRHGPCAGGTVVWLHGSGFTPGLGVRFGGQAASACIVVSDHLIKCTSPAYYPAVAGPSSRHEVPITLASRANGAPCGGGTIPFAYSSGEPDAGLETSLNATQTPKELLRRLLASLERAQAAAAAAAAAQAADTAASSSLMLSGESGAQGHAELGLSAFSAMDEHGYSLAEYTAELKDSLGSAGNAFDAVNATDAQSDLQLQHQEMAAMLKRERLSSSLSKRPSMELLQQRNILPDAERWRVGASKLETSFANRPQMQFLQERNILPHAAKEGGEEVLAKRKRLESFLVHRPTLEQVQATIGVAAEGVADMAVADVNVAGADPLASPLDDPKNEVTLEDALGVFISDNSFRQADDHSLHVDDL